MAQINPHINFNGKLKCLLSKIRMVLTLLCLEINSVLNGSSSLTQ